MTDHPSTSTHVILLATGGTISSRTRGEHGEILATDNGANLIKQSDITEVPVQVIDVFQRPSYTLDVTDMLAICTAIHQAFQDPQVLGVVVTHGTDTLEETAYLAKLTHQDPRPVVFTGAQRAADAINPDGPANLRAAVALAADPQARDRGVLVAFAGTIFPAHGLRKSSTTALQAFSNPNFGSIGTIDSAGNVTFTGGTPLRDPQDKHPQNTSSHSFLRPLPIPDGPLPRVDLIALYPGADTAQLEAALASGAQGLVIQGTGSGNANPHFPGAIAQAAAQDIPVVVSTRVDSGPTRPVYGEGGGHDLVTAGAIPSGHLSPSQALILLALLLGLGKDREGIAAEFRLRAGSGEPTGSGEPAHAATPSDDGA